MKITIFTDGSSKGNPGKGGYGIILSSGKHYKELSQGFRYTTNNRMELMAAIKTLEKLKEFKLKKNFKLRTDSKYLIDGYSNWINNWKKNGWRTSAGKPVQNLDLWQKIDGLRINGLSMEFVKGHSGDKYNERVDLIATNYSKGINKVEKNKQENLDQFDIAPKEIIDLYSRIELVSKFAQKGFLLTTIELCNLLSIKENNYIKEMKEFNWRNWNIKPTSKKLWLIQENNQNSQ